VKKAQDIIGEIPSFVEAVIEESQRELGLDLSKYIIDHVCFRVENQEQYNFYREDFKNLGDLISEAIIGGRPISTFKFKSPVLMGDKSIPCIEVPSPKDGAVYSLGLEHIECVIPEALTVFIQRFPGLKFDLRALKKALNPEVALRLPSGKSIKFHNQSLETVIEIEKKLGL